MAIMIGTLFNSAKEPLKADQIMNELRSPRSSMNGVTGAFKYKHTPEGDSYFEFPTKLKSVANNHFVPLGN